MVVVIAGPTASGKSAMALALAEKFDGTIINADASQLYADLRIITARPDAADEARVPHRLYGVLDGDVVANAAGWAEMARAAIGMELAAGRLPIVVGGTGLYLTTLIEGIAPVPDISPDIRAGARALSTPDAAAALISEDPDLAMRLMPGDRQRVLRGLEVIRSTGRSLLAWQGLRQGGIAADHDVRAMVVDIDRQRLRDRIEPRLWAMIGAGARTEVAALLARGLPGDRPVLRALGVAEFGAVNAGTLSAADAVAAAAAATRRYQKRQMTWNRSQAGHWPRADNAGSAALLIA